MVNYQGRVASMSDKTSETRELIDPAEYAALMRNIAEKSQKIVTTFLDASNLD